MEAATAAAARPVLTQSFTMRVVLAAVRLAEGMEAAMLSETVTSLATGVLTEGAEVAVAALEEVEVAVAVGVDDDWFLGGCGGTGMVTTGGTSQPPEPRGGRELLKPGWPIRSYE